MPKIITGPAFPRYATTADKAGWWLVRAACVAILVFLLAPILVMVPLSFSDSSFLAYPIPAWSLKWYRNLTDSPTTPLTPPRCRARAIRPKRSPSSSAPRGC